MESFKPTDDQLFDLHLGQADKALRLQMEAYLKTHPGETQKLLDFSQIELAFKEKFELESPSELTLQRVRKMARSQLKPKFFDVAGFFKATPVKHQLAWAAVICLVVGLSFVLKDARSPLSYAPLAVNTQSDTKTTNEAAATVMATDKVDVLESTSPAVPLQEEANHTFDEYTKAVGLYHQNQFPEACDLFNKIITANPSFENRVDLYTFWVNALNKLGDTEQAKQKEEELRQIVERQNSDLSN